MRVQEELAVDAFVLFPETPLLRRRDFSHLRKDHLHYCKISTDLSLPPASHLVRYHSLPYYHQVAATNFDAVVIIVVSLTIMSNVRFRLPLCGNNNNNTGSCSLQGTSLAMLVCLVVDRVAVYHLSSSHDPHPVHITILWLTLQRCGKASQQLETWRQLHSCNDS